MCPIPENSFYLVSNNSACGYMMCLPADNPWSYYYFYYCYYYYYFYFY